MAVQSQGSGATLGILKALGLEESDEVTSIKINIAPDSFVTITVGKYATDEEMKGIAEVLTDYDLVERVKVE